MMSRKSKSVKIPSMSSIKLELERLEVKKRLRSLIRTTITIMIVVAAVAILVTTVWFPFLQIYGVSMTPTLQDGEIVCCLKTSDFKQGDMIAFYYNNKILIKRVIGKAGDWINIDSDGNVYVNNEKIEESYLDEKAYGNGNVEFPYQVPESSFFVLGDHRRTSIDSRYTAVGCVMEENIVGKIILRVWPISKITIF